MDSDEEEESEGEREKLQQAAVTLSQLTSTVLKTPAEELGSEKTSSVLARRLGQWIDSHYDFNSPVDDSPQVSTSDTTPSAIFLISSSQNPISLTPPPSSPHHTPTLHSSSSPMSESSEDEEEEERLQEAAIDPNSLLSKAI